VGGALVSPPTVSLADVVAALARRPVTAADREIARARIADTALAVSVGLATDQGRRSAAVADTLYGAGSLAASASRMVAACRMTEIDDVDLVSCITPGSCVVPTMLAVLHAMPDPPDLERVLDAVVAGYEVALGLGEAMHGPRRLPTGVWPSLATGGVTAAVVATVLLGGDDADLERAAVLAAEQSVAGNARGTARESLIAAAVVAGIGAALSVRHGFAVTGSRGGGVLGGLLVEAVAPAAEPRIARPAVKGFCSARQAMGAVAALRSILVTEPIAPAEIDAIEVEAPHEYVAMLSRTEVTGRRDSLSSAAYQLATTVLRPQRLEDVERRDLGLDVPMTTLMGRVGVRGSDELSALYPAQWPARVRVRAGGRSYHGEALDVPAEHDHSRTAVEAKVRRFLAARPATAELILTSSWGRIGDLRHLAAALGGEHISTDASEGAVA
jgi:2-methylcitrate dehydratase PrpD